MKLILITTPTYFVEEDKIITALFEEGLDTLHLRKPDTAPMFAERLLTLIPEQYHKRIVVHGHFYLKDEYKLKGIHLNGRNPNPPENYKGHISCSCHSLDEVKERKQTCDYVFLSPVFNSISKMNYNSAYTAEELRAADKAGIIDKKVIALGGIDVDNILEVKDFGFGGAGLASTIDDYAKFTQMLLNGGTYNGVQILRPATVKFLGGHTLSAVQQAGFDNWIGLEGFSYGNLMRVLVDPTRAVTLGSKGEFGWDGWLGCYMEVVPEQNMTFLMMTQKKDAGTYTLSRKIRNIIFSE